MSIRPLVRYARLRVAMICSALLASLATVAALVLAVVAIALLVDPAPFRTGNYVTVLDCQPLGDQQAALVLFWSASPRGPKTPTQIGTHHVESGRSTVRVLWPQMHPDCVATLSGGQRIFVADRKGTIFSADPLRPELAPLILGTQPCKIVRRMEVSADQRLLFSLGPRELCAWDLDARALLWRRDILVICVANTPRAQTIVCGLENGAMVELDAHSGQTIRTVAGLSRQVDEIKIDPSGRWLASVGADRMIQVFDWPTGNPLWRHDGCSSFISSIHTLSFSPDGKHVVGPTALHSGHLTVWDSQSGEQVAILRGHEKFITGARFISNDRLISWGTDGSVRTWDIKHPTAPHVASLVPPWQSS